MFKTSSDLRRERLCVVVYGPSGVGKTTLAGTLPGKRLGIILEPGGFLPLLDQENFDFYDVTVDKEGKELPRDRRIEKLNYFLKEILPTVDHDWIIIDSLTELSQLIVENLKRKYPDRSNGFALWGDYNDILSNILKNIRDLGRNVYITALDSVDKDESGQRFHSIDVNGKISGRIPALYDELFYLKIFEENGRPVRKLICQSYSNVIAKDRSGRLSTIENPDLGLIIRKIKGEANV